MALVSVQKLNPSKAARMVSSVALIALMLSTAGCINRIWERDDDAAERLQNAPLVRIDQTEKYHLIVMQAPSPGWSIRLDATQRTAEGKDVLVTIRRPDPAYVYTQQIVDMNVLTSVRLDTEIRVIGRLLDHDEKTKGKGYAPMTVVESFE